MAKTELKIKARKLRSLGKSIKGIAKELDVSQGTISLWCRDVKLTQDQINELERHARDPFYGKRLENSLKQQRLRQEKTQFLLEAGVKDIGLLSKRELFIAGSALYWAEGFKKESQAGFCNSDPVMIKFFIKWLIDCFGYEKANIRLRVGINEYFENRTKEIENYWSNLLGIPLNYFQKPFYQKVKQKKVYQNESDYHGVIRIRIRKSSDFLRKIKGFIEGFNQNMAG